jgi:ribonuclease P protein component
VGAGERSHVAPQSLPRRARLSRPEEYARVFASNERASDRFFTVLARRNALTHPRLGLAISRKAAGNAVVRNRLKRIVREHFRHVQHDTPAIDVVVSARPGAADSPTAELRESLDRLWRRVSRKCAS